MRLKQIKLAGFKSFVDLTKIPFLRPLTAVVGPNGCGKSNTIDAVRWVLGESSAKNLRGDAMTDVIFNGSTSRAPVSVGSVELVFENIDGRLGGQYANYQEIAVKRQVNRDGESSYLFNGQKCRKKDITDIFMGTGLGPRSYAIIEQGTISRLIESKPQDLRTFIEEAAGVSRYKERRKETENRISHTRENLDRLADIRIELGNQLHKLNSQAKTAIKYRALKSDERQTQSDLLLMRYQTLRIQSDEIAKEIADQELLLAKLQAANTRFTAKRTDQEMHVGHLEQEEQLLVASYYQTGTQIARLEEQLSSIKSKDDKDKQKSSVIKVEIAEQKHCVAESKNQQKALLSQVADIEPKIAQNTELLDELAHLIQRNENDKNELSQQIINAKQGLSDKMLQLALVQSKQDFAQQTLAKGQNQINEIQQKLANQPNKQLIEDSHLIDKEYDIANKNKLAIENNIIHLDDELLNLSKNISFKQNKLTEKLQQQSAFESRITLIKQWLQSEENTDSNKLWQHIDVSKGWEKAAELLLGNMLSMPVVNNASHSSLLGFMPNYLQDFEKIAKIKCSYVNSDVNILPWFQNIRWIETREEALLLVKSLKANERIITADGYMLGQGFELKHENNKDSFIQLSHELDALTAKIGLLCQEIEQIKADLHTLLEQQTVNKKLKETAQSQLSQLSLELVKLENNKYQIEQQIINNEVNDSELIRQLSDSKKHIDNVNKSLLGYKKAILGDEAECAKINVAIENNQNILQGIANQLSEYKKQQLQCSKEHTSLISSQHKITTQLALCNQNITHHLAKLDELIQSKKALAAGGEKNALQQNITLDALKNELAELLSEQHKQQQRITEIRQQITINKEAIKHSLLQQKQEVGNIEKQVQQIAQLKLRREGLKGQAESQKQNLMEIDELLLDKINENDVNNCKNKDVSIEDYQQKLEQLRGKIKRLGAINLAAIDEYEQQNERKQYLDSQNEDLIKALASLENAIKKIDKETRVRFKTTFEKINLGFSELFPKVFGGGEAYLALTDDDLLATGVNIMARPPGKKNSTIHLLSGGEKALTALSLVFAIFRLNPAPFCMLDEVDAPLDDANVERFCRLLKEMSQTVQFIYISHNKITMEMADQLIGVTMHEAGVSRIVAVDLEEAVAMADAV